MGAHDKRREGSGYAPFSQRRNDGRAEIRVDADGMRAVADLYPPLADGQPLAPDYVEALLAREGVVEGIDRTAIEDACLEVNLDGAARKDLVVARGRPPSPEIAEHLALSPRIRAALEDPREGDGAEAASGGNPAPESSGPVSAKAEAAGQTQALSTRPSGSERSDWRERSPFIIVARGETLGQIQSARIGQTGMDVYGHELPAQRQAIRSWQGGNGTALAEGRLLALEPGHLVASGNRISVEPVLRLKEGVGYHTGNIQFPGDIDVSGEVRDGFHVHSGGKATFRDTLYATDVSVHGDMLCQQGLVGRGAGLVRVGGNLQARFLESCRVAVRGDAHVVSAIVGSKVWALGRIEAGDRGRIIGGELWAARGLSCGSLGNEAGLGTLVRVGSDFAVQQRLDQAAERLRLLAARIAKLEALAKERDSPRVEQAREAALRERDEASRAMAELAQRLDVDPDATVEVRQEVHAGVAIEICRVRLELTERHGKCRFRLDRAANRILVER